jgi:hypothetical protein
MKDDVPDVSSATLTLRLFQGFPRLGTNRPVCQNGHIFNMQASRKYAGLSDGMTQTPSSSLHQSLECGPSIADLG